MTSEPTFKKVDKDDDGIRVDRWFKRNLPDIPYGLVQKLLRKGAIKVDDKKAKSDQRLKSGQTIRVPVIEERVREPKKSISKVTAEDAQKYLVNNIIFQDKNMLAINKPAGLSTQGGSKVKISVDDMLKFLDGGKGAKYKLVHRLDKDTSGVLLIAKSAAAAAKLTESFRTKEFEKTYWTVVLGKPKIRQGKIDLAITKDVVKESGSKSQEKSIISEDGQKALTYYKVIENAGQKLSWLEVMTETGRKHQIRVHMNAIGHPVLGDGKYGGKEAFIDGISNKMHLHARSISHPSLLGKKIEITAPLPKHMKETWEMFGFNEE